MATIPESYHDLFTKKRLRIWRPWGVTARRK